MYQHPHYRCLRRKSPGPASHPPALILSSQRPKEWLGLAYLCQKGLPLWHSVKESSCNEGDVGSIPGLGRSPGVENGNPCSILAWKIPRTEEPGGLKELDTTERLSNKVPGTVLRREATTEWTHKCGSGRGRYRGRAGKKKEGVFYPLSLLVYWFKPQKGKRKNTWGNNSPEQYQYWCQFYF